MQRKGDMILFKLGHTFSEVSLEFIVLHSVVQFKKKDRNSCVKNDEGKLEEFSFHLCKRSQSQHDVGVNVRLLQYK